jgi:hypothetical protein
MEPKIALMDLDGTLADHNHALLRDLKAIAGPNESQWNPFSENEPEYIKNRIRLIRSQRGWWENLSALPLGIKVFNTARDIGFQTTVLTKGPMSTPHAWTEKVLWCRNHLPADIKITITEDKSSVYGRVLVDDYPPYIEPWLKVRPRGIVIMPAWDFNKDFVHPRVIRFDGNNFDQVFKALQEAYDR